MICLPNCFHFGFVRPNLELKINLRNNPTRLNLFHFMIFFQVKQNKFQTKMEGQQTQQPQQQQPDSAKENKGFI